MSLFKKIKQIRLCLPTFPEGAAFISSQHLHTEATAECDYAFLLCTAGLKCCHPALRATAEFEQLTSLPISICERKGKFLHSSFWRAYYPRTPIRVHSAKPKISQSQPSYFIKRGRFSTTSG